MNSVFSAALVVPLLFAPDVELAFVAEEGLTIALVIEQATEGQVTSESWCPITAGERDDDEAESSEGGATWAYELEIVVVDTYDDVEDGRVTALTRTFETITGDSTSTYEAEDGDVTEVSAIGSPLDGRTVEFVWDADEEEYSVSFDEEGDDEDVDAILLDDMLIDTFGAWFLPGDGEVEIAEGDEWSPGVDAWFDLLDIGGDFWINTVDADAPNEVSAEARGDLESQLRDNAEGDVVCTFEGLREVDGLELGVIRISIEYTTHSDVESTREGVGDDDDSEEHETRVVTEVEMTAEGECLWDIEGRRPHSIRLETETTDVTTYIETIDTDAGAFGMEWVTETETSGVIVYRFEVR